MPELIMPARYRDAHYLGLARNMETGHGPVLGTRIEVVVERVDLAMGGCRQVPWHKMAERERVLAKLQTVAADPGAVGFEIAECHLPPSLTMATTLPPELLLRVFNFASESDLVRAMHVCRFWRVTAREHPSFWRDIEVRTRYGREQLSQSQHERLLARLAQKPGTPARLHFNTTFL